MIGCLNGNKPAENKIKQGQTEIKTGIRAQWAFPFFSTCSVSAIFQSSLFKLGSTVKRLSSSSSGFLSIQLFLIYIWGNFTEGNWPLTSQPAVTVPSESIQNGRKPHAVRQQEQQGKVSFLWFHLENVTLLSLYWQLICAWHWFCIPMVLDKWAEIVYNYGWYNSPCLAALSQEYRRQEKLIYHKCLSWWLDQRTKQTEGSG